MFEIIVYGHQKPHRIFDAGDHFDCALAGTARLNVNIA